MRNRLTLVGMAAAHRRRGSYPSVFSAGRERKPPGDAELRLCQNEEGKVEAQAGELNPPTVMNHLIQLTLWNPTERSCW